MGDFTTALDIAKAACQHVGVSLIASMTEDSKAAEQINFRYDKVRKAELRRNVWRFAIRKTVLRPLDETTMEVVPDDWDETKTYIIGSLVTYSGKSYFANEAVGLNTPPSDDNGWTLYFGPRTAIAYISGDSYWSGDLVYTPATNAYDVYLSLQSNNADDPTATPAWDATITYKIGDAVTYSATTYQSTLDLNLNNVPGVTGWEAIPATQPDQMQGQKWLKLSNATVKSITMIYPVGSGPSNQAATQNVYFLPAGFMREAPQDPKAGSTSYLGVAGSRAYDDWTFSDKYFVSRCVTPIVFRFVADVEEVRQMDTMFCEGLAARLALAICEPLTQSSEKLSNIGAQYKIFMGEARSVNGIETGSDEPAEDDYISCRA